MMNFALKKAFTLIEVNLAMLVMAGGVLSMISLYTLGFRESRQSREDVAGAVIAESILNALSTALSDRNLSWTEWRSFGSALTVNGQGSVRVSPREGWYSYLNRKGDDGKGYSVDTGIKNTAKGVYNELTGKYKPTAPNGTTVTIPSFDDLLLSATDVALVATRESEQSPVMTLAVRVVMSDQRRTLFSQPVYFTDVHFQGDPSR